MTIKTGSLASMGIASFITLAAMTGAPLTAANEGISLVPYYDSVGVKTWCRGETEVDIKDKYTLSDCDLMYNIRYGYYSYNTAMLYNNTAKAVVTPEIHAALVDMAYNIGTNAVKNSSMIRHINAGQPVKACESILLYKYAGGKDCSIKANKCYGIWTRRLQMYKLCMTGVT